MTPQYVFGSGGKDGGAGGGISEDPDTLASVASARIVDLIGEGEIVGLVNNESSIYIDGVPLRDTKGTPNFKPFRWVPTYGTQEQDVLPGFAGTESEIAVGVKLTMSEGRIIRAIDETGVDIVRVTISVAGLTTTTSSGKIEGGTVGYKVVARRSGGSWTTMKIGEIKGKTGSKYQRSIEIPLKQFGEGPYEVGVERTTEDSISALIVNDLYWDSFTVINSEKFTYPNSALIGIAIDARYFSQIPTREYHVRGLRVKVPENYDPDTRKYATTGPGTTAGAWNGRFKIAYTNNPAWCFYDLATNKRYGLGRRISADQIDKWALYQIAKYCDEWVPTGNNFNVFEEVGGSSFGTQKATSVPRIPQNMEPRFTLNCVLNTQDDAVKVLNTLSSVFRGMVYWASGSTAIAQDRPTEPSVIFTDANVEVGSFSYEGSSRTQRKTTCLVAWNDPDENFRQRLEYVEDSEGIARYGVRQEDLLAFGCTSRSQARRVGLWFLYTNRLESDACTFVAGLDAAKVLPGEVALVQDNRRAGVRYGGRVVASTVNNITIDAPLTLAAGTYNLYVMAQDGTMTTKSVVIGAPGEVTTLNVTVPFAVAPAEMAVWSMASAVVEPRQMRIVSIRDLGNSRYRVTALANSPGKYKAVDFGGAVSTPNYTLLSATEIPEITNLKVSENSFKPTVKSAVQTNIEISWDILVNRMVRGYKVKVIGPDKVVTNLPEQNDAFAIVKTATPGIHQVFVRAVNHFGKEGPETKVSANILCRDTTPPANVSQGSMEYVVDFSLGYMLKWGEVEDYISHYEIRSGASWATGTFVANSRSTLRGVGMLSSATRFMVKAVDTSGNLSVTEAVLTITPVAPASPVVTSVISGPNLVLTWSEPASELDVRYYAVWMGDTLETAVVLDRPRVTSWVRRVDWTGTRTFWVQALNLAGKAGPARQVKITITNLSGVKVTSTKVVDNNVLLYWNPPTVGSLPVDYYEIRRGPTATTLLGRQATTFAAFFEEVAGAYRYWILPVDTAGNVGKGVSVLVQVNEPPDFILRTNVDFSFVGPKTSMYVEDGTLLGPVSTTESWANHFSSRGWASPQDQVTAGYSLYALPAVTSGTYEETLDYGSVLPTTQVKAMLDYEMVVGTVTVACQIYYKVNIGDAWVAASAGSSSVFLTSFRYVRVVWTFTGGGGSNLIRVSGFNLRLVAKKKADSGTFTITDANAGVFVPFNVAFIDADTPIVQPGGTTALLAIVDFADVPNPTGFTVYLHNPATGVKVTGSGSWNVRGY